MATAYCREIILLGKTGNGKSSLGNSLLGKDAFKVEQSLNSVTQQCEKNSNNTISVIDTPGLLDSERDIADIALEVLKALDKCPSPHAFIIVFSALGRMSHDEFITLSLLRLIFNQICLEHTIVVFTGYNEKNSDRDFDNFWKTNTSMRKFVEACGERIARIDNHGSIEERARRVDEIIHRVDVLTENGTKRFDSSYKQMHEDVFKKQHIQNVNLKDAMKNDPKRRREKIELFHEELQDINSALFDVYFSALGRKSWKDKLAIGQILFGFGHIAAGLILITRTAIEVKIVINEPTARSAIRFGSRMMEILQSTEDFLRSCRQSTVDKTNELTRLMSDFRMAIRETSTNRNTP